MPSMTVAGLFGRTALSEDARSDGGNPHDGAKVVARMKELPTDDPLFGKGSIRIDGRKLVPAYLFEVKKPESSNIRGTTTSLSRRYRPRKLQGRSAKASARCVKRCRPGGISGFARSIACGQRPRVPAATTCGKQKRRARQMHRRLCADEIGKGQREQERPEELRNALHAACRAL